eukprot:6663334-Prorocentrum_lima.AAC.1
MQEIITDPRAVPVGQPQCRVQVFLLLKHPHLCVQASSLKLLLSSAGQLGRKGHRAIFQLFQ